MAEIVEIYKRKNISGLIFSVPLEWYTPKDITYSDLLLRPSLDPKRRNICTIKSYIVSLTLILLIIQTLYQFSGEESHLSGAQAYLTITIFCSIHTDIHVGRLKASQIAALINGLIQFDSSFPKAPKKFKDLSLHEKLSYATVYAVLLSDFALPFALVFGLHWNRMRAPSLAGYWLNPLENQNNPLEHCNPLQLCIHIGILLVNFWIWVVATSAGVIVIATVHLLCIITINSNIHTCQKSQSSSGHGTTVIVKLAQMWRQIQIQTTMLNELQGGILMLAITTSPLFTFAFSVTTLVKMSNNPAFAGVLIMLICDCALVIIIILGGMAKVHSNSAQFLAVNKSRKRMLFSTLGTISKEYKWKQRFYWSCSPLKIHIVGDTFVDACTPINFIHFAVDLSANVLLLEQ